MDQTLRRVAVIGGVRIPFCRSNTLYADQSNLDMLIGVLNGLVDKYKLAGVHIDEAVGGAVVSHSRDWNLAREAVLGTKLAPHHARHHHAAGLRHQPAGRAMGSPPRSPSAQIESGIAMGSDTTSDAPIVFKQKFAHRLVEAQNAKSVRRAARRRSRASRRPSWRPSRRPSASRARVSPWASTPS